MSNVRSCLILIVRRARVLLNEVIDGVKCLTHTETYRRKRHMFPSKEQVRCRNNTRAGKGVFHSQAIDYEHIINSQQSISHGYSTHFRETEVKLLFRETIFLTDVHIDTSLRMYLSISPAVVSCLFISMI
jgi:hypothetical protein